MMSKNMLKTGIKLSSINKERIIVFKKQIETNKKVFKIKRKRKCLKNKV